MGIYRPKIIICNSCKIVSLRGNETRTFCVLARGSPPTPRRQASTTSSNYSRRLENPSHALATPILSVRPDISLKSYFVDWNTYNLFMYILAWQWIIYFLTASNIDDIKHELFQRILSQKCFANKLHRMKPFEFKIVLIILYW